MTTPNSERHSKASSRRLPPTSSTAQERVDTACVQKIWRAVGAGYVVPVAVVSVSKQTFRYPTGTVPGTELRSRQHLRYLATRDEKGLRIAAQGLITSLALAVLLMSAIRGETILVAISGTVFALGLLTLTPCILRFSKLQTQIRYGLSRRETEWLMEALTTRPSRRTLYENHNSGGVSGVGHT